MITIGGEATKIHLATGATDLRRGYSGLYTLIEHELGGEPKAGHLWVFTNRNRDLIVNVRPVTPYAGRRVGCRVKAWKR